MCMYWIYQSFRALPTIGIRQFLGAAEAPSGPDAPLPSSAADDEPDSDTQFFFRPSDKDIGATHFPQLALGTSPLFPSGECDPKDTEYESQSDGKAPTDILSIEATHFPQANFGDLFRVIDAQDADEVLEDDSTSDEGVSDNVFSPDGSSKCTSRSPSPEPQSIDKTTADDSITHRAIPRDDTQSRDCTDVELVDSLSDKDRNDESPSSEDADLISTRLPFDPSRNCKDFWAALTEEDKKFYGDHLLEAHQNLEEIKQRQVQYSTDWKRLFDTFWVHLQIASFGLNAYMLHVQRLPKADVQITFGFKHGAELYGILHDNDKQEQWVSFFENKITVLLDRNVPGIEERIFQLGRGLFLESVFRTYNPGKPNAESHKVRDEGIAKLTEVFHDHDAATNCVLLHEARERKKQLDKKLALIKEEIQAGIDFERCRHGAGHVNGLIPGEVRVMVAAELESQESSKLVEPNLAKPLRAGIFYLEDAYLDVNDYNALAEPIDDYLARIKGTSDEAAQLSKLHFVDDVPEAIEDRFDEIADPGMDDPRDELAYDIWKIYNKFLGEGFNASRKQDRLHFMDWLLPARPPAPPNPAPKVPNYVLVWLPEYRKNHRIEVDPKEYVERPRPHEIKLYDSGLSWEEVYNVVFEWVAEQKAESDFRRRQEEEQKKAQRDADCHQEDVGDGSDEEDDDMNDEEDDDMNDEEDDGTSDEEDDVTSEEEEDDDMSEEEEDDDTDEEGEENKSREAEDLAGEGADDEDPSSSQPFDDHEAINEAKDEGDVDQSQDVSANTGEDVDEQNEDPSELFADNEWVDEVMNHDKEANDGTIHGTSDEEGSIDEEVKDATSNLRSNEEVEEGDSLQKSGGTAGLANGDDGDDDDFEGPMYGPISAWDDEGEL